MKKALILFFLMSSFNIVKSQIKNIPVLIGKTDKEVTNYFDSLFSLKSNPYYKVEKKMTASGDLILEAEFSLEDQEYYSCLKITSIYMRTDGIEYCVQQNIYGYSKYGYNNLYYIKDNFRKVKEGIWETDFPTDSEYRIKAALSVKNDNNSTYDLTFWLSKP